MTESHVSGAEDPGAEAAPDFDESRFVPVGTLFILLVFLMGIAGMWVLMYLNLLGR